ncbi:tyrosine-type recombinase/integrase [Mycobacterium hubeiense]|uniref:tyrosine-type recombinase/integrase n=1 Tax=Mycobacterium hubeiense TaxID=1867256 RepID=UPI0018EACF4E|nr:tyrosine-type recombinase/integrase [Mycobacterium sp. QGD 101]
MRTLRENVTDYLATRRALGFKLEGLSKLLLSFVEFCEERGATRVQNDLAIQWATTPIKVPVSDTLIARRLDAVRIFARYQHTLDPLTQIPAEEHRPRRYRPKQPNVLSQNEICALLAATSILEPAFKALTWRTLIGLLAATGLRPGEACRLAVSDINLAGGVIQGLETKFGKSRLVFSHPSTATVVTDYLPARQAWVGAGTHSSATVVRNTRRGPICPDRLNATFREIVAAAGLATAPGRWPVRLHDLRPTFAVTTMIDWYRAGQDVQARLPLLSPWLGHVDPASTYWYLQAVPELLTLAADRLDKAAQASATKPAP